MWWVEHVHEVLNVVQGLGHGFAGAPVLVEVNVQGAGYVKQTPDVRISRLFAQTVHCSEQLPMTLVFPVAACCDGLHDLRGGAPAFLGSLADVAGGELGPGLGQEDAAGFEVLLSGRGYLPAVLAELLKFTSGTMRSGFAKIRSAGCAAQWLWMRTGGRDLGGAGALGFGAAGGCLSDRDR